MRTQLSSCGTSGGEKRNSVSLFKTPPPPPRVGGGSPPPVGSPANRPLPFREHYSKQNSSSPHLTAPSRSSQKVLSDVLCFRSQRRDQENLPPPQTRPPFPQTKLQFRFPKTELSSVFSERPPLARAGRVCSDTKKVSNSSSLGDSVLSFHRELLSPRFHRIDRVLRCAIDNR